MKNCVRSSNGSTTFAVSRWPIFCELLALQLQYLRAFECMDIRWRPRKRADETNSGAFSVAKLASCSGTQVNAFNTHRRSESPAARRAQTARPDPRDERKLARSLRALAALAVRISAEPIQIGERDWPACAWLLAVCCCHRRSDEPLAATRTG